MISTKKTMMKKTIMALPGMFLGMPGAIPRNIPGTRKRRW